MEALADCRDQLRTQVDLRTFSTASTVADLEDLRRALDYEEWNLLGISYGTRVALAAMALTPNHLRSVILDSVDPTDIDIIHLVPRTLEGAVAALAARCDEDPACANAYPDLAGTFSTLVERLDDEPIEGGLFGLEDLDGVQLLASVHAILYSPMLTAGLPAAIDGLDRGDVVPFRTLLEASFGGASPSRLSDAIRVAFACAEQIPLSQRQDLTQSVAEDPIYHRLAYWQLFVRWGDEVCEVLDIPRAEGIGIPYSGDVPALALAGEFDPITPPEQTERVASELPAAQYALLPHRS